MTLTPNALLILDPSLRDTHSHHHALCSAIVGTAHDAAMGARVLAHSSADPAVFAYPVTPTFRRSIYDDTGRQDDKAFSRLVRAFVEDLLRSEEVFDGRPVLVHSCTAAFLQALADVLSTRGAVPGVLAVQLMFHPFSFLGDAPPAERANTRYTRALSSLRAVSRRTGMALHVSASCASFARHFGALLGETIPVHPAVSQFAEHPRHHLPGGSPKVLLLAGDPKPEKGFCWIVDALPRLLETRPDIEFWIHAGANRFGSVEIEEALGRLSALAGSHGNLQFASGYLDPTAWADLLSGMDAVLLPYAPSAFAHRSSGILWEAVSCLAPSARLMLCAGTWLADECRAAGIAFTPVTFNDTGALANTLRTLAERPPVGSLKTLAPAWWERCFGQSNSRYLLGALTNPGLDDRRRFMAEPTAWWRAQEAIRQARAAAPEHPRIRPTLLYSPGATLNSYQSLLYCAAERFGVDLLSVAIPDPLSPTLLTATHGRPLFFHQHWLKDVYWGASSVEDGELRIQRHLGVLRALKGFGTRILWTLHNLAEHDASALQLELGRRMLRGMAGCADHILCHTPAAIDALGEAAGADVIAKASVLQHPLYSDLLAVPGDAPPPELRTTSPRLWLMTGLLRPYKGTQELLRAWQRIRSTLPDCPVHLVIAGHIQDPAVHPVIAAVRSQSPGSLTVIPRRLTDAELAAVLRRAELVVAPYREVLTSGTYYLATTFGKPVLAPARGMFTEVIAHGESGWLYDGSEAGLEQQLRAVIEKSPEAFRAAGDAARRGNAGADAATLSARFFSWLLSHRN